MPNRRNPTGAAVLGSRITRIHRSVTSLRQAPRYQIDLLLGQLAERNDKAITIRIGADADAQIIFYALLGEMSH
jgi:hypothetical protein